MGRLLGGGVVVPVGRGTAGVMVVMGMFGFVTGSCGVDTGKYCVMDLIGYPCFLGGKT
jgi:hypothetical protein